jgi:hypothetical protein
MKCEPFYYSGLSDCNELFKDVVGMLILEKKTTLSAPTAKATYASIVALASGVTGMFLPIGRGYQNNTAEPELATSQVGLVEKVSDPLPQLIGFLDRSYCDYKTLWALDGKSMDVILFMKNGKIWHSQDSAGNVVGFRAKLFTRKNAPAADNSLENFPIYVNFQYLDDLDRAGLTTLAFGIKELDDLIPVGLEIKQVVSYASGDITVDIVKRGSGLPFADITDATSFNILRTVDGSTDLDIDVTAVDVTSAANGRYVLTIQKDASGTPADITAGVYIQAVESDGGSPDLITYVSAPFLVVV